MTSDAIPGQGRVAALDYGEARIGVAICDGLRMIASPWTTLHRAAHDDEAGFFERLVEDEQLVGFVVGLPLHASGDDSRVSTQAREFAEWLRQATRRPVALHDERFSTNEARRKLQSAQGSGRKKKARLDQVAAQVILESWLESEGRSG